MQGFHYMMLCKPKASSKLCYIISLLHACSQHNNLRIQCMYMHTQIHIQYSKTSHTKYWGYLHKSPWLCKTCI